MNCERFEIIMAVNIFIIKMETMGFSHACYMSRPSHPRSLKPIFHAYYSYNVVRKKIPAYQETCSSTFLHCALIDLCDVF
jgi:hypothetical protein